MEALDPINAKPTFTEENFAQHPGYGLAASQLCGWVQGVISLHSTLQTKVRPLQARAQSMKASLSDFTDKLTKEEGKASFIFVVFRVVINVRLTCTAPLKLYIVFECLKLFIIFFCIFIGNYFRDLRVTVVFM